MNHEPLTQRPASPGTRPEIGFHTLSPVACDGRFARATDADINTLTTRTKAGQLMGTLPYMSPEQVAGDPAQLDTRSDVYALGVVLYELLSGTVPHDMTNLSLPEAARKIRDDEPSRLASANRSFRGEIETIVAKAMEKDKTRRYQSASDLAADIRRYLRGEAIEAKRDSALYVFRKTVARYRGLAAGGTLLVVLLAAFGIVSFLQGQSNRRLADGLATALTTNRIERGRLLGLTGSLEKAEDLIWRGHLQNLESYQSYWALWELYARNPCLATLGAKGFARDTAFSPNGRYLATAGDAGEIVLWDPTDFRHIDTLDGHRDRVWSLSFSPDSSTLASGGGDGGIVLWEVASRHRRLRLEGHDGQIRSVSFSPDGRRLVSGGDDASVRIWDVASGRNTATLRDRTRGVQCVRYSPDGALIASAAGSTITLCSGQDLSSTRTLAGHEGDVGTLAFTSDGRILASGSQDRLIKLWDVETGVCLHTLSAPNGSVRTLLFVPDARMLLSAGWRTLDLWDTATTKQEWSVRLHRSAYGLSLSPDRRMIALASGRPRVWEFSAERGLLRLGGHSGRVAATISPDGRVIASGDSAGNVRLWETSTGRLLDEFEAHTGRIRSLRFDPYGTFLATGGDDQRVRLWVLATGKPIHEFDGYNSVTQDSIAFSPDGRTIAFACHAPSGGVAEVWRYHVELHEVSSGALVARLPSSEHEIVGVHFSRDGATLATTARRLSVRLWSASGEPLGELAGTTTAWTTTFSTDGRRLAAGTWGDGVQVWDRATRKRVKTLEGHNAVVYGVAYHPRDPRLLASASADGTVRLWDMAAQQSLVTLTPFDGYDAVTVAFSPNGRSLVVAGAHETVVVYDLTYYDRHIAGHIEYQIERLRPELGDSIQDEKLLAWRDEVLRRPWPRFGASAEQSASQADALPPGVDPQIIAARGSNPGSSNP